MKGSLTPSDRSARRCARCRLRWRRQLAASSCGRHRGGRRHAHHEGAVRHADGEAKASLKAAGPGVPEGGDDRSTRRSRARPSRCSSSRPSARPKATKLGHHGHREARSRSGSSRSRSSTSAAARRSTRRSSSSRSFTDAEVRDDVSAQLISREALQQGDEGRQRSPTATVTRTTPSTQTQYCRPAVAEVRVHPRREEQGDARRDALHAAEGRRQDLVHARQEVLPGSGLEGQRRQASPSRRARPSPSSTRPSSTTTKTNSC